MPLFRLLIWICPILIAAGLGANSPLRPFDIKDILPASDPVRIAYEKHQQKYQTERFAYIIVSNDKKPFDQTTILDISRRTSLALKRINALQTIVTPASLKVLTSEQDHFHFVPAIAPNTSRLEKSRWLDQLIATSHRAFLIRLEMLPGTDLVAEVALLKEILQELKLIALPKGVHADLIGSKVVRFYLIQEMLRNQKVAFPIVLAMLSFGLFLLFHSVFVIIASLTVLALAYLATLASIVLIQGFIDPYSTYALFLVMVIATADLVHYFSAWTRSTAVTWRDRKQQINRTILRPCAITTATTIVCFASLVLSESSPVRSFGIYSALGTLFCFLLTFGFLPTLIEVSKRTAPLKKKSLLRLKSVDFSWLHHRRRLVFVTFASIIALAALSLPKLAIHTDIYNQFISSHPMQKAVDRMNQHMDFLDTMDVVVSLPSCSDFAIENQAVLTEIRQLNRELLSLDQVTDTWSILDLVPASTKPSDDIFKAGCEGLDTPILQLFKSLGATDQLLRRDPNELRMILRLKSYQTSDLRKTATMIANIGNMLPKGWTLQPVGSAILRTRIEQNILPNFIQSFTFSLVGLWFIFLLCFRSVIMASVAMIPNLLPIALLLGFVGTVGIAIQDNLILIACVVVGVSVDDTIHFIWKYRAERKHQNNQLALSKTLKTVSLPLIGTTLLFALSLPGFLVMQLKIFLQIGGLIVLGLIFALAADLLLLPLILERLESSKKPW